MTMGVVVVVMSDSPFAPARLWFLTGDLPDQSPNAQTVAGWQCASGLKGKSLLMLARYHPATSVRRVVDMTCVIRLLISG